jgi:hypothetical protein
MIDEIFGCRETPRCYLVGGKLEIIKKLEFENERLKEIIRKQTETLKAVEWQGVTPIDGRTACPFCGKPNIDQYGNKLMEVKHRVNCILDNAIKLGERL